MARSTESGYVLTTSDIDDVAVRIATMWDQYNQQRRNALSLGEEARQYIFATDIDSTSARLLPHKNRIHIPKLTEISDNLQSQYWEATLSTPDFFKFFGTREEDKRKAPIIEAWIRTKLEQRKFRETVGRQWLTDYVNYGNVFGMVDYGEETDSFGRNTYKGPIHTRISPLDIVFNPQASAFKDSPKITRHLVHVAALREWPSIYPNYNFNEKVIARAVNNRSGDSINDWVEVLKERGLQMDGFNTFNEYFKGDLVEVLIYRGDVYNPTSETADKNRIVYVIDRVHIIRNEPNKLVSANKGLHHAGWRTRNDNLWAQGPLDNLIGMQYHVEHLENLKADVFDIIAQPVTIVKGENIQEPEEGYRPGASYYAGVEEDVTTLVPDATALRADTMMEWHFRQMENFAGSPPETRGIRTPGEKTAFEVSKLDSNATKMFVDKARNFEMFLEGILLETFEIMLQNFDGVDYIEIFDDIEGSLVIEEIDIDQVMASGQFQAIGARHWSRRNREAVELRDFQLGPLQDPALRRHVNFEKYAEIYERVMGFDNDELIEPFAGIKEDVRAQAIAQEEAQKYSNRESPDAGQQGQAGSAGTPTPAGTPEAILEGLTGPS